MTVTMNLNTEQARMLPQTVFSSPLDIVTQEGLTRGQKIATLERWKQTLLDSISATGEGMMAAQLEEVGNALQILLEPERERMDLAEQAKTQA